ncbi:TPA: cell division protein SepF [Candidatus Woesearchaeota archaeon]|nr:cell division protein SepF [Candidatus Woesearchaeota archaeon]
MKDFLLRIKERFNRPVEPEDDEAMNSYVEVSTGSERDDKGKVNVRRFVIEEFEDIKEILDVLREGSTIALVNIKPLKDKDLVELKRAVSKLRKTCEAIDGDIAGFGEDYVVAVPYFARIHRAGAVSNAATPLSE